MQILMYLNGNRDECSKRTNETKTHRAMAKRSNDLGGARET
jgi:hypothetical protein